MPVDVGTISVGVVGARGYVGAELLRLIDAHPVLRTTLAVSRQRAGERVDEVSGGQVRYVDSFDPRREECPDVLILGLPNGLAKVFVDELDAGGSAPRLIVDLSADYRFDHDWTYSVPELHADFARRASRIANPGCYATAMQLALAPLLDQLASPPHCFGVSGYSGAGTTPSEKNDAEVLAQGVLPYSLVAHTHEQEVSRHLGQPVRFAPCVAGYPRGITLTALVEVEAPTTTSEICAVYERFAEQHELIGSIGETMPRVQDVVGTPRAVIGGISVDTSVATRAAVVCTLDNLLKGAASQAIQNINIALGLDPLLGVTP